MAEPKPPQSAAAARAERAAQKAKADAERTQRKADRAEAGSLKKQQQDAKRARSKLPWGRDWKDLDKLQRNLGARERRLRKKKYD
jgi:hypothetical protein